MHFTLAILHLLQGEQFHPVKGVWHVVDLGVAQGHKEAVSHKLDILQKMTLSSIISSSKYISTFWVRTYNTGAYLGHQPSIHPNEIYRKRITDKLPLDRHCLCYNFCDSFLRQLVV